MFMLISWSCSYANEGSILGKETALELIGETLRDAISQEFNQWTLR